MKLQYDFSQTTRALYLNHWECFLCGCNGWNRGGLEIHHIMGRVSKSPFNSSCLCGECHRHIGHNKEEHQRIFGQTLYFLKKVHYKPDDEDWKFLEENYQELVGEETKKIIVNL